MANQDSEQSVARGGKRDGKIELIDLASEETRPDITVLAADRTKQVIERVKVGANGTFQLSDSALKKAAYVIVGPDMENLEKANKSNVIMYRTEQFLKSLQGQGFIPIPKIRWYPWSPVVRCVHGSVSHCIPYPQIFTSFLKSSEAVMRKGPSSLLSEKIDLADSISPDVHIAKPSHILPFPYRCETVCDGLVEVFRRTCCCTPWIVFDPRLDQVLEELKKLVQGLPPFQWPPRPEPDPLPIQEMGFIKEGALDEHLLRARQDLQALETLSPQDVADYITARPYLHCTCGASAKVAEGFIQPNGEFTICWTVGLQFFTPHCHEEFAYIVKQNINGDTVTIYNGLASNTWFRFGDDANLVSYHRKAQGCRNNEFHGQGAFALLQDIGVTPSYHLKTPAATEWDRVGLPQYNDGLAFPAVTPVAAKGGLLNRNWGGMMSLRYHFSEPMKAIGAKYYRVSVVAADANGNPSGPQTYLAPQLWRYYEVVGTDIFVRSTALGPKSEGEQHNLYEIPYDADRQWQSGQYHALLDSTQYSNSRHLLTVEVFNSSGQLIRPTGTPDPGSSTQGAYTYRRWFQENGPTAEVPFAALTHMFWWDNRKAKAQIIDLREGGTPNPDECQVLSGPTGETFSVGYRAYHDEPLFLLDHRLWWRRGLGGPTGILTSPHPNLDNVGVPPAGPHESGTNTFVSMLGSHQSCSFVVNLHSNVKTFNGFGTLDSLDAWDQAAFALEIGL